jgi:hypothetical protein
VRVITNDPALQASDWKTDVATSILAPLQAS